MGASPELRERERERENAMAYCSFVFVFLKVYSEHLLQPLMETIVALSGPKTKIMVIAFTTIQQFCFCY